MSAPDPVADEVIANLIGACEIVDDRGFMQCDTHDLIVRFPDDDKPAPDTCEEFDAFRRLAVRVRADERKAVAREIEAADCEVSAPLAFEMACCARQRQDARIARGSDA